MHDFYVKKAGNTPFFLFILNRVAEQSNSISDLISIFLKYEADIFAKNNVLSNFIISI